MYSDSIRERQQELLDVLFKKASGRSEATFIKSAWPQPTGEQLDILRRTLTPEGHAAVAQEEKAKQERALKEEYQRLVAEYKSNNPKAELTEVAKHNLRDNAEWNVKERRKQESYKQMEQARLGSMGAFSPTPSAPAKPSTEGTVSRPKPKVETPSPVEVGEVDAEDSGYYNPDIQFPKTPDVLPLPKQTPTSTPEKKLVSPAPKEKSKEEKKKEVKKTEDKKNDSKTDPITLAKALIDKALKHKAISIGGIGGAGLGAILGNSTRDKILYALLGGAGGSGLGYLLEKYIK